MFYGNRGNKPHVPHYIGLNFDKHLLHRSFQFKYSLYLLITLGVGSLIFMLPVYYFVSQNYKIFIDLAFKNSPNLVENLEQEVSWIKTFILISFLSILLVTAMVSIKMTKNLIAPLLEMEKHMKNLMKGNWDVPAYQIENVDPYDFRDLALTYDYFYRSLKANTAQELKVLTKLSVDPKNRDAYLAWQRLIKIKQEQLGEAPVPAPSVPLEFTEESLPNNVIPLMNNFEVRQENAASDSRDLLTEKPNAIPFSRRVA